MLHEVHAMHRRMAASIGPDVMPLFESIEAACRHVVPMPNSLLRIYAMGGHPPDHSVRELYAFLLLRHPKLRMDVEAVAEYFCTNAEEVRDYEATGVLTLMGVTSEERCVRLMLACEMLDIKGSDLAIGAT